MEPEIIINGVTLTDAQCMAVRAAVTNFNNAMSNSSALGDDAHGRCMTEGYYIRTSEVLRIMQR